MGWRGRIGDRHRQGLGGISRQGLDEISRQRPGGLVKRKSTKSISAFGLAFSACLSAFGFYLCLPASGFRLLPFDFWFLPPAFRRLG